MVQMILISCLRGNFLHYIVPKEEVISLATGIHRASDLIDKAIIIVHIGRIYIVVRVISGKTSRSPFPPCKDGSYMENNLSIFPIVIILKKSKDM